MRDTEFVMEVPEIIWKYNCIISKINDIFVTLFQRNDIANIINNQMSNPKVLSDGKENWNHINRY